MDNLDWQIIKLLHEEKSAIRVADKVHLSQPAIMYRLSKIESELGITLFLRNTRGISFTSAGERLHSYTDRMIRQYANMYDYVHSDSAEITGTITLGSSSSFSILYLPQLLKKFIQLFPGVSIQLVSGLSNELIGKLRRQEIYAAIIRGDHVWHESEYEVLNEPVTIVSTTPINYDTLPYLPYINYRSDSLLTQQISSWWKYKFGNIEPNSSIYAHDTASCLQFVQAGLGFSIMPSIRLPTDHSLYVEPLKDKDGKTITRRTRLLYHRDAENLDAYNAFIKFLISELPKLDFVTCKL